MYQNKLRKGGVQDVVNVNKMKFEPYCDLVDQAFSQFNENLINNQDPHSQIENDKLLHFPISCHKYYQMQGIFYNLREVSDMF